MHKNLIAEKAVNGLTNQQMADIIGVCRTTYEQKMRSGRFAVAECFKFSEYFSRTFEYLFATDDKPA